MTTIPNYLSAESPSALRRLMFRTNRKHRGFVQYDLASIKFVEKDSLWYVWYFVDIEKLKDMGQEAEVNG